MGIEGSQDVEIKGRSCMQKQPCGIYIAYISVANQDWTKLSLLVPLETLKVFQLLQVVLALAQKMMCFLIAAELLRLAIIARHGYDLHLIFRI